MSQLHKLINKAEEFSAYESDQKHTWCSGCGNFGILNALKRSLVLENIKPQETLLCFDVGCNSNASDKIKAYTIHGLHGRVASLASGAAIANTKQKVIAMAGDGATFSEGINHLVHAVRNDYPITFIVHNNNNYGLTIGQASSTTKHDFAMNGSPDGVIPEPLNTLQFVLSFNPSFVARSFSGDIEHMTKTIQMALNHRGFAYVEIMQACPTFNKATPQEWYWDKIFDIQTIIGYDKTDIWQARKIVDSLDKDLAVGVIYEKSKPNFVEQLKNREGLGSELIDEVKSTSITGLLQEFR
ncbi:MAG: thiamine pyrophosphate-dependent enzyme [Patescibacteria group bacterium]